MPRSLIGPLVVATLVLASCGSDDDPASTEVARQPTADTVADDSQESAGEQRFPDVIDATATEAGGTWTFDVTVSSPYDTPERYADGWRILGPDGTEFGFRLLTHDHAGEQPFTRSLSNVSIPDGVDVVTIEGRDQANGFGGETFELQLR